MVDYPYFSDELRSLLAAHYARGGRVDEVDAPPLTQRLGEDSAFIDMLMYQQAMHRQREEGLIEPLDWAGDLSGARQLAPKQQLPAKRRKYADGGEVEDDSGENYPPMSEEEFKRALEYLYKMQNRDPEG